MKSCILLVLFFIVSMQHVHAQVAHGNSYRNTPAPPTPAPAFSADVEQDRFTPGVLFLDLVNVYGGPNDPILSRVNVARTGPADLETGKPGSLTVNLALDALDLSAFIAKNLSQSSATASAVTEVPIVDNAIFMLYCDTTRYVDHLGNVKKLSTPDAPSDDGTQQQQQQQKPSFWGSNLCNTVNLYLKMPSTGSSRVQWLFYAAEKQLASAREVSNFTQLSRHDQATEWDVPHTFSAIKDLLWSQKYCRDVVDECVFHAFSASKTYQHTQLAKGSERLPVYNMGESKFYPKQQFHNLWSAIESPLVAPALPSNLAAPSSAADGSTSGSSSSSSDGPFENRMSMEFANLESNAWLMTVNRMPPLQLLTTHEAKGPADSATLLLQMEAVPSSLSPEGFYTAGILLSLAAIIGICLFLVICKAIVPRILFLREVEATGGAAALQRIDEELIAKFEKERQGEEVRSATIAHLGRVTGAPMTPEDLDALESFTQLPVGDMILSAIVEERQREMKEQLSSVSDKFAALPRVLFARALRLVDRSLFSTSAPEPGEDPSSSADASASATKIEVDQQQQQQHEPQDPIERQEEQLQLRRQQLQMDANLRRATELRDAEMRAQIEQVQQFQELKQKQLEQQLMSGGAEHADPNRPSADAVAVAVSSNDDDTTTAAAAAAAAPSLGDQIGNVSFSVAARQEQQKRAAALLRSIDNHEMGIADADLSELLGSTALQVRDNVQNRLHKTSDNVKNGIGSLASGMGNALEKGKHFVVEKGYVLTDALGVTHHGAAPGEQQQQQPAESSHEEMVRQISAPKIEIEVPDEHHDHPVGPADEQVLHSPIARQQREMLMHHGAVEVPASRRDGVPIVSLAAVLPPPSPRASARRQQEREPNQDDDGDNKHENENGDGEQEEAELPSVVATPAKGLPPLPPSSAQRLHPLQQQQPHHRSASSNIPVVAYGIIPRGASPAGSPREQAPSSPRNYEHTQRYEHALQRHLQEDEREFDACRDEPLPLKFSVDTEKALAMGSPRLNQVHSQHDIYDQFHRHHAASPQQHQQQQHHHHHPVAERPANIPHDVPCCRRCGDVMPFVDLFVPCQCTRREGRRYIHRRCLEAERRLDAFADGGAHAEFCWRCSFCRGRYTIAPNSISLWSSIPQKSPLAQTIHRLINNPVAPLLALWVLLYLTGYIVKFIAASMTLDYLGTSWSALTIYHWVLGAWFLLSFALCEQTLRGFFDIFEPATRRIIIIVVAAVAPLLLGYIGHFVLVCVSYASWSWETFYGLGVVIEAILFFTVVPRLAMFAAHGAGALYDRLPSWSQQVLQSIVP